MATYSHYSAINPQPEGPQSGVTVHGVPEVDMIGWLSFDHFSQLEGRGTLKEVNYRGFKCLISSKIEVRRYTEELYKNMYWMCSGVVTHKSKISQIVKSSRPWETLLQTASWGWWDYYSFRSWKEMMLSIKIVYTQHVYWNLEKSTMATGVEKADFIQSQEEPIKNIQTTRTTVFVLYASK